MSFNSKLYGLSLMDRPSFMDRHLPDQITKGLAVSTSGPLSFPVSLR